MTERKIRRNLVRDLDSKEAIDAYLHPKKRTRWSMFKRLMKPIIEDKKLLVGNIIYAFSAGVLPLLSAFIISTLVEILGSLLDQAAQELGQALPLIITVGLYCIVYMILSVTSIQTLNRLRPHYMYIRLDQMIGASKKWANMELGLTENALFQHSLGNFFGPVQASNSGMEGIYTKVTETSKDVVAAILLSILLISVNPLIPVFAILALCLVLLSNHLYTTFHSKLMPDFQRISSKKSSVESKAQDFSYGKDIRVFKMRESLLHLSENLLDERAGLQKDLRKRRLCTTLPKSLGLSLVGVGLVFLLGYHFIFEGLSLASLVMLVSLIGIYTQQINNISQAFAYIYEELVDMEYFYDFQDADLSVHGGHALPEQINHPYDIDFKDVWFRYPGSDDWVLEGLNLYIGEGQSLALVGVNGAGKTTLTNLLTGLYQAEKGTIKIAGIDISTLSQEAINDLVAIVLQDYEPLAVPVKENVAGTHDHIHEERVEELLDQVGLLEKIQSYDKGIDSMMLRVIEDEGLVLSGGENQKLSIARALYKEDAKILVLDEPTSALDAIAEEEIYQNFEDLMDGRTGIFISHRLASTRFCDQIALLDGGRITQLGTHEELLDQPGLYRDMYETQASYYKEEEKEKGGEKWA